MIFSSRPKGSWQRLQTIAGSIFSYLVLLEPLNLVLVYSPPAEVIDVIISSHSPRPVAPVAVGITIRMRTMSGARLLVTPTFRKPWFNKRCCSWFGKALRRQWEQIRQQRCSWNVSILWRFIRADQAAFVKIILGYVSQNLCCTIRSSLMQLC